ncbi:MULTISPECIES: MotA/TolQ/ExbB proton channel family protein [Rhodomicrobium]|uniref:MotA/TolQ/ExbB proton channel family protein n=1 Tax=Rhodomicrobium TaxID=1068 RepID=UPI001482091C|nr:MULTISPECIES: MotA/TolQ/ExbB proton channel family protein [Rhodomicrobium]
MNPASGIEAAGGGLSVIELLRHADPVVQFVVAILVSCSIASWALILEKSIRLSRLSMKVRELESVAAAAGAANFQSGSLASLLWAAASQEDRGEDGGRAEFQQRLERSMRMRAKQELRRAESGLSFLATVGSTAPFIGLFGTVWGIMHSFSAIAQAKDTSLAVVAPGIAEALFATAVGLVAAVPAVIAYNQISASLGRAAERIGVAVASLARHWSKKRDVVKAA